MVIDHLLRELFYVGVTGLLLGKLRQLHFGEPALRGLLDKGAVGGREVGPT
jgi:hypothetical protein